MKDLKRVIGRKLFRKDLVIEEFTNEDRTRKVDIFYKGMKVHSTTDYLEVVAMANDTELLKELYQNLIDQGAEVDVEVEDWGNKV